MESFWKWLDAAALRLLKAALVFAIRRSPVPLLARHLYARRKVSILLYHDPAPEVLDRHLSYLARRFTFLPLDRLVDAIRARDWSAMPRNGLVVTFDDGHRGNFALVEIFRRHRVLPTVYVCSQIVATNRRFWFKEAGADAEPLKRRSNRERLRLLEERVGFAPTREYPAAERQALSAEEMAAMNDLVDFQSHTRFHPVLTTCSDEQCEEEIAGSKVEVEALSGRECRHFSYPNGDYTEREIELVGKAGYASARTIDVGWNGARTDPFRLKITGVPDNASIDLLAAHLSGLGYLRRLLRGKPRKAPADRRRAALVTAASGTPQ